MKLVGIINITPDSFSDGGQYNNQKSALAQAEKLIQDGAEILDIGAESTRPQAQTITPNEEWQRLKNILPKIINLAQSYNCQTSIDTRHPETAHKALDLGIDIINDVSGLADIKMINLLQNYNCKIIINHNLGIPVDPNITINIKEDPVKTIKDWAIKKINLLFTKYNIDKKNIIFDVGIGFGKTAQQSIEILNNIQEFTKVGVEIYVGHSRKSFLNLYQPKNILAKDLLTAYFANNIAPYTDYIRVHNIALVKEFINMKKNLKD